MSSLTTTALRLMRHLIGPRRPVPPAGKEMVLDGLTAVAVTEAHASQCAAVEPVEPVEPAMRHLEGPHETNAFGEPFEVLETTGARGAVQTAVGLALSGQRTTAMLSGADLPKLQDLLVSASGRHVPIVLHVAARAPAAHAAALGSGHETYHGTSDTGLLQLFAVNVQEAVDLTVIARLAAERALVPAIVAMDGAQTAQARQDACLLDPATLRELLGDPADHVSPATPAQREIFGDVRRRVPRWFDADRPLMLGSHQGIDDWGLGAAAMRPHFEGRVDDELTRAFAAFEAATGRSYAPLLEHRVDDAKILLVAQGAAVETAIAAAGNARRRHHVRVGVLGVRALRPFPSARLAECMQGVHSVAVLERVDTPLAGDGPLLRELRAALDRAGENARCKDRPHAGHPAIAEKDRPRLIGVPYGLGGFPLRATDLVALVQEMRSPRRSTVYLGVSFAPASSAYPKRQARVDALKRDEPSLATLGLRSAEAPPDVRPEGALTMAIHRRVDDGPGPLAGEVAATMHALAGGHVRCRSGVTLRRFDEPCTDVLTWSEAPLHDPGDDVPVDVVVCATSRWCGRRDPLRRLVSGGTVLVHGEMPAELVHAARAKDAEVLVVEGDDLEVLLGAALGCFARRSKAPKPVAAVRAARSAVLEHVSDDERAQHVDVCAGAYEVTLEASAIELPSVPALAPAEAALPPIVCDLERSDRTLDCVAHFWDQVGVVDRTAEADESFADPYLAAGAVPPRTACFRPAASEDGPLPVFDPTRCDGSARGWTSCPDGSVAPLVIAPRALIEAGIDLAAGRGQPVDALRSVVARVAKRAVRLMADRERPPVTAGALLNDAFAEACSNMDDARRSALAEAMRAVIDEIGSLPIARTPAFFERAEETNPGTGELFTLVVNPDACRCPELLLEEGEACGLVATQRTPAAEESARSLWNLRWRLPDPPASTIERAEAHPDVGALGARLLRREALLAMCGGDGGAAGSGARLALHRVLAIAEHVFGPRRAAMLEEIDDLSSRLAASIRERLSEALPSGDLDALAEGLDALGRTDVDLSALSARLDEAVAGGHVDGARLGRLVDVGRGLADLHWRVSSGSDGFGRAKVGVVVTGETARWAGAYPDNPFIVPVAVDAVGDAGDLARGLAEGPRRQTVAAARLMRWARLELERPAEAARAGASLAGLRFDDLTDAERAQCPPILLAGDDATLRDAAAPVARHGDRDVKVLVLDACGSPRDGGAVGATIDAMLGAHACVVQTSLAHPDHFALGVERALACAGPALVYVHAPDPERDGIAASRLLRQARLAVSSRAWPLMVFDAGAGETLGSCLDLSGNPDPSARWSVDEDGTVLTPVDWAATEQRFALELRPLTPDDPDPLPIASYLALAAADRSRHTPFIGSEQAGSKDRVRVGPALVADADARDGRWRLLRELAGLVTPEHLRDDLTRDLTRAHEIEIATLTAQHEVRIAGLRAEFEREAADRVARGLMTLAGYSGEQGSAS